MTDFEEKINLKKFENGLSFELPLKEKSDELVKLMYNFILTAPTLDLILSFGTYHNPAYTFPYKNPEKIKITLEIIEG